MSAKKSAKPSKSSSKPGRARATSPGRSRAQSARDIRGSVEARAKAAVILEVLCGVLVPTEGAAALGLSLSRYYVLETRALAAVVEALEPRARGRRRTHAKELADMTAERDRLAGEVSRLSALVRATERVVGLDARDVAPAKRRRSEPRGRRVVRALRAGTKESSS